MPCNNQCCGNESLDLSVCELVLLDDYVNEATLGHDITPQGGCWVGMTDDLIFGDLFCLGCDLGCHACDDSSTNTHSMFWDREGFGYLRPNPEAVRKRDATNKIRDFPVFNQHQTDPLERHALFANQVELQRAACYWNQESFACWGNEAGHPCHCYHRPGPDCEDHGYPPNSGLPLPGFLWDRFFFEMTSWPMRNKLLTSPGRGAIHCRKWTDGARSVPEGPMGKVEVDITVRDHEGQTRFMNFHRSYHLSFPRCNADAMIGCSGYVSGPSDCSMGLPLPEDCQVDFECDCSVRQGGNAIRQRYCGVLGASNCNHFNYLRIAAWNPSIRAATPMDALKNEILAALGTIQLPGEGPLDSLEHQVGPTGDNALLNHFLREWEAGNVHDAPELATLSGRVRWGNCPVNAAVVLKRVRLFGHVIAHVTYDYNVGPPVERLIYVSPYTVFRIEVELGIRADFPPGAPPCLVDGQDVSITYGEGDFFPTVSPEGNGLCFTTDVPKVFTWSGRLNQHSEPPVPINQINPEGEAFWNRCSNHAARIGQFTVPALPGDYGADEPLTNHQGSVTLYFANTADG